MNLNRKVLTLKEASREKTVQAACLMSFFLLLSEMILAIETKKSVQTSFASLKRLASALRRTTLSLFESASWMYFST
jgi:hypothetical protein